VWWWVRLILSALGILSMITGASGVSVLHSLWPHWEHDIGGNMGRWLLVIVGLAVVLIANSGRLRRHPQQEPEPELPPVLLLRQRKQPELEEDLEPISVGIDRSPEWHNFQHVARIVEMHVTVTNQTDSDKEIEGYVWRASGWCRRRSSPTPMSAPEVEGTRRYADCAVARRFAASELEPP